MYIFVKGIGRYVTHSGRLIGVCVQTKSGKFSIGRTHANKVTRAKDSPIFKTAEAAEKHLDAWADEQGWNEAALFFEDGHEDEIAYRDRERRTLIKQRERMKAAVDSMCKAYEIIAHYKTDMKVLRHLQIIEKAAKFTDEALKAVKE